MVIATEVLSIFLEGGGGGFMCFNKSKILMLGWKLCHFVTLAFALNCDRDSVYTNAHGKVLPLWAIIRVNKFIFLNI